MGETEQTVPPSEEQISTPQPELVIHDLETLRALSDPLRLRILELLAQPQTAKTLAAKLALGKTKLYYHLNLLEKHGIIRVVRTRVVSGIIEKSYQVTALSYRPAKALLLSNDEGQSPGTTLVDSILDTTRTDLVQGLRAGTLELGGESPAKRFLLARVVTLLTPAQAATFFDRLQALLDEVAQDETAPADGCPHVLTLAFFPKAEEE